MNRRPNQSRSGYDSFSPHQTAHLRLHTPDAFFFERRRRPSLARRLAAGVIAVIALFFIANFAANQFVFVHREAVPVRGLVEAFDGYTILHISDLKGERFGGKQGMLDFMLDGDAYDIVLITGDMISPLGNAQPFFKLLERLREMNPDAPVYYIAGDGDPLPVSMDYAAGGSPFAPWVLGAAQRGAQLLSSPVCIEREGQRLWLMTRAQLSLDIDTMQSQYERQYLSALSGGDDNQIELAAYQLNSLESMRSARRQMTGEDVYIALTHVLPDAGDAGALASPAIPRAVDLMLGGHYLGGLLRLPALGPLFVPSSALPRYGVLPGKGVCSGLSRQGTTWMYASSGLGARDAMYPEWFFRMMNPPSATLISLTPSSL